MRGEGRTESGNCVCLVSNARYQRYLDFALSQLCGCGLDVFVICDDDVSLSDGAMRIRSSDNAVFGDIEEYPPNANLNGSLKKVLIPYVGELASYSKVLYLDCDVELRRGWESVFSQPQRKPILATRDVGIDSRFAAFNRMEDFYKNRPFEYCNTGVMLIDRRGWTMAAEEMMELLETAYERKWVYADQDILNASGMIDASLDARFNTFSHLSDGNTLISHYTAAVDAKERLDRLIAERRTGPK